MLKSGDEGYVQVPRTALASFGQTSGSSTVVKRPLCDVRCRSYRNRMNMNMYNDSMINVMV